jgi:hypothetical protein
LLVDKWVVDLVAVRLRQVEPPLVAVAVKVVDVEWVEALVDHVHSTSTGLKQAQTRVEEKLRVRRQ